MAAFSLSETTLALLILITLSSSPSAAEFNVTALISSHHNFAPRKKNPVSATASHPDLSDFANLLTASAVAADLADRSSLTILAVPNTHLRASDLARHPTSIADVIRYHVLLEYLSWPDLRLIPASGRLVATLYQTTGRAFGDLGSVNVTRSPETGRVSIQPPAPDPSSYASILALVETLPYSVSVFTVSALLIPSGFDTMAADHPPLLGLNITRALLDGHNFNVAAALLAASGVVSEFEADEGGAGITLFVPTDD
uniref:FAS1 domain-containing protein n=1 Tax=Kalanchoe fedtschenkoi TaxID=63787 RepID=A0A7N0V6F0_KALFE